MEATRFLTGKRVFDYTGDLALPSMLDSARLRKALLEGLYQWTSARGEVVFPCQSLDLQTVIQVLNALFTELGNPCLPENWFSCVKNSIASCGKVIALQGLNW